MSDTRRLEASPRKRARALARFGRPVSLELSSAALLALLFWGLPSFVAAFTAAEGELWNQLLTAAKEPSAQWGAAHPGWGAIAAPLADIARSSVAAGLTLAATALGLGWLQRGALWRVLGVPARGPALAAPRAQRFDSESWFGAGLGLLKWLALMVALGWPWLDAVGGMLTSWQRAPAELPELASGLAHALIGRAAFALALIGLCDLALQHWLFRRRLRMSEHELRQELRETEAAGQTAAERRRRAYELKLDAALRELGVLELIVCDGNQRAIGVRVSQLRLSVWLKLEGDLAAAVLRAAAAQKLPIVGDASLTDALSAFEPNEQLPGVLENQLQQRLRALQARWPGRDD